MEVCCLYVCVGVVRQSGLMSDWWQLCDWCNGGWECVCRKCSEWWELLGVDGSLQRPLLDRSGLCELLGRSGLWSGLCELLGRSGLWSGLCELLGRRPGDASCSHRHQWWVQHTSNQSWPKRRIRRCGGHLGRGLRRGRHDASRPWLGRPDVSRFWPGRHDESRPWFSRHVCETVGTDGALLPPPSCVCLLVRPASWLKTWCRIPPPRHPQ